MYVKATRKQYSTPKNLLHQHFILFQSVPESTIHAMRPTEIEFHATPSKDSSSKGTSSKDDSSKGTPWKGKSSKSTLRVKLTILQGKDLGEKSSSNSYVEIWAKNKLVGKTKTIKKTLTAHWNESFDFNVTTRAKFAAVTLKIFDQNLIGRPVQMGEVELVIPVNEKTIHTKWHQILADSDEKATGQLQLKVVAEKKKKKKESSFPAFDTADSPLPPLQIHNCNCKVTTFADRQRHENSEDANKLISKLEKEYKGLANKILKTSKPFQTLGNEHRTNELLDICEFLQRENKELFKDNARVVKSLRKEIPKFSDILLVKLTIIRANDLPALDRNIFEEATTSDPYVEVYNHNREVYYGKTKIRNKTLSPVWNVRFDIEVEKDSGPLVLRILDWNKDEEPDFIGQMEIATQLTPSGGTLAWHEIPKPSAPEASGRLELRVEVMEAEGPHKKLHRLEGDVAMLEKKLKHYNEGCVDPSWGLGSLVEEENHNQLTSFLRFLKKQNRELMIEKEKLEKAKGELNI